MNPVVTAISGWLASMLAGAVFVEYIFDWKGIGVVIVNALDKYDFPVVMGAVLFISVILVVINLVVDMLYGLLDPRIRQEN
jgi:peptide/nickel transport system permease protein